MLKTQGAPLTRPDHGRLSLCPDPEAQAHGLQGGAHEGVLVWAVLCGGRPPGHPAHPSLRCSTTPRKMLSPMAPTHVRRGRTCMGECGQWDLGIACPASSAGDAGPSCLVQKNKRTVSLGAWLLALNLSSKCRGHILVQGHIRESWRPSCLGPEV